MLLLLLWVLRHRRWQVLSGMIAAGVISLAVLSTIFPRWMFAYLELIVSHRSLFSLYATTTIGSLAHTLWGTDVLRFAEVGLLPLVFPLLRLADSCGWLTAMNLALLVSVPMAMYGFSAGQIVLFPAIVQIVSWLWYGHLPPRWARAIGAGLVLVYAASFAILVVPGWRYGHWFVLIPLAWAGLYVLALKHRTRASVKRTGYLRG